MASCFRSSHIHSQEVKSQELGNVCITHFIDNYLFEMLICLLRRISIPSFQNYIEIEKTTYSERFMSTRANLFLTDFLGALGSACVPVKFRTVSKIEALFKHLSTPMFAP